MTSFSVRLEPPDLESEFRADALLSDRRVATGLAIVAIVFLIVTLPVTQALSSNPVALHEVWAIRAVDVAVAVVALLLIRRADSPRAYDAMTSGWIGIWFVGIVAENALLPATFTSFVSWDAFLAVAVYVAVSLPFGKQAALAALLSGGDIIVLWKLKSPSVSFDLRDMVLAYVCANVVGAFVSRERHGLRRRAFLAMRREVATRTDLEAALREVKTLQGIIPICSHCKNVRTGAGEWQEVEAYVRAHSDAHFSHGVCPACMKLHYPQVGAGSQ